MMNEPIATTLAQIRLLQEVCENRVAEIYEMTGKLRRDPVWGKSYEYCFEWIGRSVVVTAKLRDSDNTVISNRYLNTLYLPLDVGTSFAIQWSRWVQIIEKTIEEFAPTEASAPPEESTSEDMNKEVEN